MENKLYSVQYLRALAATLVVIAHAGAHPLSEHSYFFDRLGQLGVTLFFAISGFIMVAITGTGRVAPVDFLRRRVTRIVPLYWAFTTLAAVLALVAPSLFRNTVFTVPHFVQSLLFVPHAAPGTGSTSPLLSLGWTLNYEMFFYLCFAACAFLVAATRVTVLTVAFVGLFVVGLVFQPTQVALQFYSNPALLAFCAGTWVGLAHVHGRIVALPPAYVWGGLAIAVLGLFIAFVIDQEPGEHLLSFVALIAFGASAVALGLRGETIWPKSRWLELLGDASYAVYLVHMFVVGAVVAVAGRLASFDDPAVYLATIATCTVVATAAGVAVHLWFEKPVLRWLRGRKAPARAGADKAVARA